MQIQINSDHSVDVDEPLTARVRGVIERVLARYDTQITRVEVHLSDENSRAKGGDDDMRCLLEARLEGLRPLAASQHAATLAQALDGAADKLSRRIGSEIGKLRDQRAP